jgi:hypothetical protein
VIHHVPHAAGYVAVHESEGEAPSKEEVVSAPVETPTPFKAIPEEHLELPVEQSFFASEDDLPLPFDNFEDELPLTNYQENSLNDHVSDEESADKSDGAS